MLLDSLKAFSSNHALHIEDTAYSYQDLDLASRQIASRLRGERIAIFGGRSFPIYASVLAAMRSGRTYIPLGSEQPDGFLLQQLHAAMPDILVVDRSTASRARRLIKSAAPELPLLCFDSDQDLLSSDKAPSTASVDRRSDAALYEMFTSGTSGRPKRIAIPRSNVADYLRSIGSLFDFGSDDRFSQFFNLTFDLSVHDLLVAWTSGGCLFVPSARQLIDPVRFARKHALSVWFSVPSLARLAMIARRLSPNALSCLRHALFCGEALPWQVAAAFSEAAPNAAITNLYGPTEATIAITSKRYDPGTLAEGSRAGGSVPIGSPFSGQEALVVDADGRPLPEGEIGELLLGGSQLAPGYCAAPELTAASFLERPITGFESRRWYRTGDLVRRSTDELTFVGRADTQIKFRGHRLELGAIEDVLADGAGAPLAIVIPSYQSDDAAVIDKLVGLVAAPKNAVEAIRKKLIERLPPQMVPAEIVEIPPHGSWWNKNGKVDRRKLSAWYESHRLEGVDG